MRRRRSGDAFYRHMPKASTVAEMGHGAMSIKDFYFTLLSVVCGRLLRISAW